MNERIRLLIFGLGYTAGVFARHMKDDAEWIAGTVRSVDSAVAVPPGPRVLLFDGRSPGVGVAEAIRLASHIVVSIAPDKGDPVLALHASSLRAAPDLRWIGYLSSVGVYGDHDGAWVDEATEPRPASPRSRKRLETEQAWAALAAERDVPFAIFRIAGIYGPGRNPFVRLAAGAAHRIVKPGQVFNRMHVNDIATALVAALHARASGIFNLADDEPAPPQDVVSHAAALMGVDPPPEVPFAEAALSPMARSFYGENKRVANRRMREDLGVSLAYPTYRDGLAALWETGAWQ